MNLGGYHLNQSKANKKIVVGFPLSLGTTRDWVFAIFSEDWGMGRAWKAREGGITRRLPADGSGVDLSLDGKFCDRMRGSSLTGHEFLELKMRAWMDSLQG